MLKRSVAVLAVTALAFPVLAQTPTPAAPNKSGAMTAPATHDTGANPTATGYGTPSARNSVLTDQGGLRTSKIVGSSVYNDHDEKIGSVEDIVIHKDKTIHAILSVGGFLGMGNRLVQVPLDKLQFGKTKESSDDRVVLPGATKTRSRIWPSIATPTGPDLTGVWNFGETVPASRGASLRLAGAAIGREYRDDEEAGPDNQRGRDRRIGLKTDSQALSGDSSP